MPNSRNLIAVGFVLTFVALNSYAQCSNTTEVAEQSLWNVHNCWVDFRDWFRNDFNLQEKHWDEGWGWKKCDPTFAFPKMMNSGYLITYGLLDDWLGPWHSNEDYYKWASGAIHDFRYQPNNSTDAFATAFNGFWRTNRVEMKCLSFNNRTAGVRAGTMLHEAAHIIYYRWKHQSKPSGCGDDCADDWFYHDLDEYTYGQLAGHKHSMTQIQIEFICDLSEFPQSWVPAMISTLAGSEANSRMINRIRNPPGWTCGLPRPMHVPKIKSIVPVLYLMDLIGTN